MEKKPPFQQALESTRIIRAPKHQLATFGSTTLRYVLLSVPGEPLGSCRVREGEVTAERPQIMTPEALRERFSGFGEEAADYQSQLETLYGSALRSLEYRFRNNLQSTKLETASLADVRDRALETMVREDAPRTALLQGMDRFWSLSVMKFILDMTIQSFPGNLRELDDRGLFDPEARRQAAQRRDIDRLFALAARDKNQIRPLGEVLRASGLFKEYEDRFFALINN